MKLLRSARIIQMNLKDQLSKFESIQSAKIIQSNFRAYLSKRNLKNNSQHKSEKQLRDTFHTGYQTHPFKGVRNLQTRVQDCIIDESMSKNVNLGGLFDILRESIAYRAIHRAVERHRYIGFIRSLASGTNDIPLKVRDAAQLVVQELQSPHLKEWRDFAHSIHQGTKQDRKVAFQQKLNSMAHYPRRQEFIDFITNFNTKGIPLKVRDAAQLVVQELQSPHLKEWRDFAHSIHQGTEQDRKVAFQQRLNSMTHDPRRQEFIDFITNFNTEGIPFRVRDAARLVIQELQSPHLKEWRDFAHSIHQRTKQDRKVAFQQKLDSMTHDPRRQEFIDFITNFNTEGIPVRVRDAARLVVQEF